MNRNEIEQELRQWNTMVHDPKAFQPNCISKFTWENEQKENVWIFINDAQSIEDLIRKIKCQMFVHRVESSKESDLIINYY